MIGRARSSKAAFYKAGGLSNPSLFRRISGGGWTYWQIQR